VGALLSDEVFATALLDRLLHHAEVIAINGRSYLMKDRLLSEAPAGVAERARIAAS
jgi:DNA replication protein DnaC